MKENSQRVDVLYRKHNEWLRKVCWNICGDVEMVDELVSELYCYLLEKGTEKLWYLDSFNLGYCNSFLKTRFINKIKIQKRYVDKEIDDNLLQNVSEELYDESVDNTYQEIKTFLKQRQSSDGWVSAKIAEMYYFGKGFTIEGLAKELNVSKSTVFLHLKKMRVEIKANVNNPYDIKDE